MQLNPWQNQRADLPVRVAKHFPRATFCLASLRALSKAGIVSRQQNIIRAELGMSCSFKSILGGLYSRGHLMLIAVDEVSLILKVRGKNPCVIRVGL
jgi:hypothetical protein